MQVNLDTSPRAPQAPPPDRSLQSGPAAPADVSRGREANFGPETRLELPSRAELEASLETLRAQPPGMLALVADATQKPAEPRKPDDLVGASDDYRLNFEEADIKDVLQAVLGNVLKVNYTLAPGVMGRITISSSSAQSRTELLSTLETVLATLGYALTKTGSGYRVSPTGAPGGPVDDGDVAQGYGISVVPLHYTSAASMSKLLSGLVTEADGFKIDTARNVMIVRGPAPKRADIVRAIASLDVDWMQNQSVSVFELRRAKPEEVVAELAHVFNTEGTQNDPGSIQFKAVPRLRSVMVISKTPSLIRRAGVWIHRLDAEERSTATNIFIYRPRFRDAKELVKLVNGIFSGNGGGDSQDDPSNSNLQQAGLSSQNGSGAASSPGVQGASAPGSAQPSQAPGMSSSPFAGGLTAAGASGAPAANSKPGASASPIEAGQEAAGNRKAMLTADMSNNTIVAYTDGETYAKMLSVMRQLDVAPLQVEVNVIIAEVQLNKQLQFGVQFYLSHGNTGGISLAGLVSQVASPQSGGFNFLIGGAASPDVIINALDTVSRVEILSAPSLVVMENKPATLQVGDQVPVTTQTAQSTLTSTAQTINSVQYLDTGIILKILPRVGQNGTVAMEIDQEISSVTSGSSTLTPTISKRRITSDISVLSGQTVLLAGLISDNRTKSKTGIPGLDLVPGVSDLLASHDNSTARNEIVVFIRPVVVRNSESAARVADDFKAHLQTMRVGPPPVRKP
jgi:general secretion pathway protein D